MAGCFHVYSISLPGWNVNIARILIRLHRMANVNRNYVWVKLYVLTHRCVSVAKDMREILAIYAKAKKDSKEWVFSSFRCMALAERNKIDAVQKTQLLQSG